MENRKNKNKIKEQIKRNTAITLVALVVTIVVLLILAGVSLNLVLGNNGIIKKAGDASKNYEAASGEEKAGLESQADWIDSQINGGTTGGTTPGGGTLGYTNIPDTNVTNPGGATPVVKDGITVEVIEPDANEGIVISVNGNEYVWVEVPKTAEVYKTAGTTLNINALSEGDYTKIKNDLKDYTADYKSSTWSDIWYAKDGSTTITAQTANLTEAQKALTKGCGLTYDQYGSAYNKMLKSMYTYGGFWIGRYEVGIENSYRNFGTDYYTEHPIEETPVIKANAYPYNWVRCSQAQTLSSKLSENISGYTSGLMFGIQWDLTLKFLETKGATQSELKSDSTTWGNYYDNLWDITNTSASWSRNNGSTWTLGAKKKESNASILLTTGASTSFSKMNIYDLAGNVLEWTLEYTSDSSNPCALRGGSSYDDGSYSPAASRNYYGTTTDSNNYFGFRTTLYVDL